MKILLTNQSNKLAHVTTGILTFFLLIAANTASTFVLHETKQPKSIDNFKLIK